MCRIDVRRGRADDRISGWDLIMLTALFADIHGNREALEACLDHARAQRAEGYVFLGDYVGYGADPAWVVDVVRDFVEQQGAIAVVGNHDRAVSDPSIPMNRHAEAAIAWTRTQLGIGAAEFLARLPMTVEDGPRLYVHGDASAPARFHYVTDSDAARRSLQATHAQTTFCGHMHAPAIYALSSIEKLTSFQPVPGIAIPLLKQRRWISVLGSVGQPRDGDSAACYATFDQHTLEITYHRVPYDIDTAAEKIRAAGLPPNLADRLYRGR
jgi:diadenosine tetraphosphatase ApaH/serine/threonine PP2A family protein phosphatase